MKQIYMHSPLFSKVQIRINSNICFTDKWCTCCLVATVTWK